MEVLRLEAEPAQRIAGEAVEAGGDEDEVRLELGQGRLERLGVGAPVRGAAGPRRQRDVADRPGARPAPALRRRPGAGVVRGEVEREVVDGRVLPEQRL